MIGKNNPLNIRYSHSNKWLGLMQDSQTKGFCNFVTLEYGVRAACVILMRSYRMRGIFTIEDIIRTWAPPSENNTDRYIEYVCNKLGVLPVYSPCFKSDFPSLISAMSRMEGNYVSPQFVESVILMFNIRVYNPRKK